MQGQIGEATHTLGGRKESLPLNDQEREHRGNSLEPLPTGERVKRRYSRASVFSAATLGRSAAFLVLGLALLFWDKVLGTMPEFLSRPRIGSTSFASHFYLAFIFGFFLWGPFRWVERSEYMTDALQRTTEFHDDGLRDWVRALLRLAQAMGLILLVVAISAFLGSMMAEHGDADEYVEASLFLLGFLAFFPVAAAVLRFIGACWRMMTRGRAMLRLRRAPVREGQTLEATFEGGDAFSGKEVQFMLQCLEERRPQTWGAISRRSLWPWRAWGVNWTAKCDLGGRSSIELPVPVVQKLAEIPRRHWAWELCVEQQGRPRTRRVIGLSIDEALPEEPAADLPANPIESQVTH